MSKNTTILIVEDDHSLRSVLVEHLGDAGFTTIEAQDGASGLAIAEREHPTLILMDIYMPKMDGITMLTKLRSGTPWGKHAPVIVLSNSSDAETIAHATGLGASDFLIKSQWSLEDIVHKIRERLNLPQKNVLVDA